MNFGPSFSAARFVADNPVVPFGEIWVEQDTGFAKRGTGSRQWNDLPYWAPSPAPTDADDLRLGELVPSDRHTAFANSSASSSQLATQTLALHYFTARRTEAITQMETYSGSTAAAATPTVAQVAVYEIAPNGDGTLLASSTNDTAMWSATLTAYTKTLDATVDKVAGKRYAGAALIVTAVAAPILMSPLTVAATPVNNAMALLPPLAGAIAAQSSLPASFAHGATSTSRNLFSFRLVP